MAFGKEPTVETQCEGVTLGRPKYAFQRGEREIHETLGGGVQDERQENVDGLLRRFHVFRRAQQHQIAGQPDERVEHVAEAIFVVVGRVVKGLIDVVGTLRLRVGVDRGGNRTRR